MKKGNSRNKIMLLVGFVLILAGVFLCVLLYSLRFKELWVWYETYQAKLLLLEQKIAALDKRWQFAGAIILLFAVKCFFPIYPISTICFLTGIVLPMYLAIPINIVGLCTLMTLKYYLGRKFGAGNAWKLISKVDKARQLIQQDGKGNPWLLVALRLVPFIPVNTISGIYGSFDFGIFRFLVYSLIGSLPRLISFTYVGRKVLDPLSASFLVPVILILFLTGASVWSVNGVWTTVETTVNHVKRNSKKKGDNKSAEG